MYKLVALYKTPADPEAFRKQYFEAHLPLAAQMPGLVRTEVGEVKGAPGGGPSEYWMMAELYFQTREAMEESMASQESRAAIKTIWPLAKEIMSTHIVEVL